MLPDVFRQAIVGTRHGDHGPAAIARALFRRILFGPHALDARFDIVIRTEYIGPGQK